MHPAFPRNQASLSFPPPSPKPSGSSTSIVPSLRAGPLLRTGLMGMAMLSSCLANAAPDAGQALRDVESRRLNLPAPVELDAERPSPEDGVSRAAEEGGPTVLIKRFQLSGNRQFDDRRLLALLHDLPGQELNLSQLHAAAARIGDFYQEKGYVLARAFLPAQEIQDGTVRIEVLEGRYGRIELHNTSRTLDRVLLRPLSALERDTAVQGSELERALLLLSDIPGLQAKGTLLPGQAQGTTDLRVEARPARWSAAGWRQTTMAAATWGISPGNHPRLQQPAATGRPGETEPAGQRPAPTLLPCSLSTAPWFPRHAHRTGPRRDDLSTGTRFLAPGRPWPGHYRQSVRQPAPAA